MRLNRSTSSDKKDFSLKGLGGFPLSKAATFAAAATLLVSIVGGGGPNGLGLVYRVEIFLAILTASILIASPLQAGKRKVSHGWLVMISVFFFVPILQLVPLPAALWSDIESRKQVFDILNTVGQPSSTLPIALDSGGTLQAWVAMIPAYVLGICAYNMRSGGQKALIGVIVIAGFVSIFVGLIQGSTGGSVFNFYPSTHSGYPTGFFANRNHQATFLVMTFVCSVFLMEKLRLFSGWPIGRVVAATTIFAIAVLATYSRAGIVLFLLSVCVVFLRSGIKISGVSYRTWVIAAAVCSVAIYVLLSNTVTQGAIDRFSLLAEDGRWSIWRSSYNIAGIYFPFGVGFGNFVTIFNVHEPIELLKPSFVNRAHNDYLELVIEAGIVGILLAVGIIVNLGRSLARSAPWRAGFAEGILWLGPFVVALHSVVDYPLRTQAISCVMAVMLGVALSSESSMRKDARDNGGHIRPAG